MLANHHPQVPVQSPITITLCGASSITFLTPWKVVADWCAERGSSRRRSDIAYVGPSWLNSGTPGTAIHWVFRVLEMSITMQMTFLGWM